MDALRTLDGEAHRRTNYGKLVNRIRRVRDLFRRGDEGRRDLFVVAENDVSPEVLIFASLAISTLLAVAVVAVADSRTFQ